jgi:putative acetyltransferase
LLARLQRRNGGPRLRLAARRLARLAHRDTFVRARETAWLVLRRSVSCAKVLPGRLERKPLIAAVVDERGEHRTAVLRLHRTVFGGDYEAELVERLDRDGLIIASLVALEAEVVVGHILFSDLAVEVEGRPILAASLAPLAVRPDFQRRGIGTRLVADGLRTLRDRGRTAVIVLGHPGYYRRFDFSAELARKLAGPFKGESFMALELVGGALDGLTGSVRYPAAFRFED